MFGPADTAPGEIVATKEAIAEVDNLDIDRVQPGEGDSDSQRGLESASDDDERFRPNPCARSRKAAGKARAARMRKEKGGQRRGKKKQAASTSGSSTSCSYQEEEESAEDDDDDAEEAGPSSEEDARAGYASSPGGEGKENYTRLQRKRALERTTRDDRPSRTGKVTASGGPSTEASRFTRRVAGSKQKERALLGPVQQAEQHKKLERQGRRENEKQGVAKTENRGAAMGRKGEQRDEGMKRARRAHRDNMYKY